MLLKTDSQKMYKIYDDWPRIAQRSYADNISFPDIGSVDHIVYVGMGGSGAIGDVLYSIFSNTDIHFTIVKGYHLPKTIDENTLVLTTSVSGNTSETLHVLNLAHLTNCKLVSFCSGGKMYDFCKRKKISCIKIPLIHSPRSSFLQFLYPVLKSLESIIPLSKTDMEESILELEKLSSQINSKNLNQNNPALDLAQWIHHIPIIYYPAGLTAAAIRFKNSLQENCKTHVIVDDILETCHNGIMGWESKANVQPILIRGPDDHPKTKDRWNIIKNYFKNSDIDYREVSSVNGNILSKLVYLIYLLDYTSIYKSIMMNVDPSPVKSIDYIKNQLSSSLK